MNVAFFVIAKEERDHSTGHDRIPQFYWRRSGVVDYSWEPLKITMCLNIFCGNISYMYTIHCHVGLYICNVSHLSFFMYLNPLHIL